MQWKNVKLIYFREMRDQLRDRRTLFLIAVLPLLLYPLLGASFFQVSQFLKHTVKVLVVGGEELDDIAWLPPLIDGNHFDVELFDNPDNQQVLELVKPDALAEMEPALASNEKDGDRDAAMQRLLDGRHVEVVLEFPPGFGKRLNELREALVSRTSTPASAEFPEPELLYKSANEESQVTKLRVEELLRRWQSAVTEENLSASKVPVEATKPFELRPRDVSQGRQGQVAAWSKILPFFVFIWALTGAFYPAVDLCAGEKERGTLETLLTSPALRREIVWGKLLTVMTFSTVTSLLNLGSLGLTGKFVIDQLARMSPPGSEQGLSMPPLSALFWLVAALVPMSALFSALCLAFAAFARSTKEGQYYLMPLMLVILPLMMLPMSPGVELNLGNSLVPVTGLVLLLRSVIEGQYDEALRFVGPVVAVTLACCLLAIRWAEEQFNRESVLFRESERLELGRWLAHLVRDRGDTPSFAQAVLCVAIILVVQFFVGIAISAQGGELDFRLLAKALIVSQLACIFAPAALMTIMLVRCPRRTLLLDRTPRWTHLWGAVALALLLHAPVTMFAHGITKIYPVQGETEATAKAIEAALDGAPNFWVVLGLMALLPALCEEMAFRGFVLSGARHLGHKWWAIALSAVAFGMVHPLLHQKITATTMGLVIGFVAVQTSSLWPCVLLHAAHNSIQFCVQCLAQSPAAEDNWLLARLIGGDEPLLYHPATVVACLVFAGAILWGLHGVTYRRTAEEQLEEARRTAG